MVSINRFRVMPDNFDAEAFDLVTTSEAEAEKYRQEVFAKMLEIMPTIREKRFSGVETNACELYVKHRYYSGVNVTKIAGNGWNEFKVCQDGHLVWRGEGLGADEEPFNTLAALVGAEYKTTRYRGRVEHYVREGSVKFEADLIALPAFQDKDPYRAEWCRQRNKEVLDLILRSLNNPADRSL